MEPCTTYQNTHHQLTVVIGSQRGKTCWPFRFKLMSNINCSKQSSRGKYEILLPDKKVKIRKRAAEHGVLATIRHFSKIYLDRALNESTVRG